MDTFAHIKVIIGIILSLSIAHLLKGTVKLIEHPKRYKPYGVHLLWALYVFLMLIHFWWWEIRLKDIVSWNFIEYFFVILYAILYYSLCVLLFPDDLQEYDGYEDYFYSRKKWFFIAMAVLFAGDYVDTLIKGKSYVAHLGWEYPVRNIAHIILCIAAAVTRNRRFHTLLVWLFLLYELSWIFRFYNR